MLGAIAGDVIGSVFEGRPIKSAAFPLFEPDSSYTDDTVLTVAIVDAILKKRDYGAALRDFGRRYPDAGYGMHFRAWLFASDAAPYNSFGNGAAMRVSPVGLAFDSVDEVLDEAGRTAAVTHNHPEGIKGAQATALAVFLARMGSSKEAVRQDVSMLFGYDLDRRLDDIRPGYHFDVSCQGSVPESIIAFLESHDFESAVRNAISLGGDADTMACIAGAIAQAFYKTIPKEIIAGVNRRLPREFLLIIQEFEHRYGL